MLRFNNQRKLLFFLFTKNQLNFHQLLFNILEKKQRMQQIKYYKKLEEILNSSLQSYQVLHIDLSYNSIGDKGTSGLFSAIASCTNLSNLILNLSYNSIRDQDTSLL
ncbi:hypothetical protein TTHERM_001552982, partial (macronuclear) [Tetrahymena thermophila SB210]